MSELFFLTASLFSYKYRIIYSNAPFFPPCAHSCGDPVAYISPVQRQQIHCAPVGLDLPASLHVSLGLQNNTHILRSLTLRFLLVVLVCVLHNSYGDAHRHADGPADLGSYRNS